MPRVSIYIIIYTPKVHSHAPKVHSHAPFTPKLYRGKSRDGGGPAAPTPPRPSAPKSLLFLCFSCVIRLLFISSPLLFLWTPTCGDGRTCRRCAGGRDGGKPNGRRGPTTWSWPLAAPRGGRGGGPPLGRFDENPPKYRRRWGGRKDC